jgi:hypothetical protein
MLSEVEEEVNALRLGLVQHEMRHRLRRTRPIAQAAGRRTARTGCAGVLGCRGAWARVTIGWF